MWGFPGWTNRSGARAVLAAPFSRERVVFSVPGSRAPPSGASPHLPPPGPSLGHGPSSPQAAAPRSSTSPQPTSP